MIKNKIKGFTLIELLAVIIILAIVALIATPIVLNVIDKAKESARNSEINMIIKGIKNSCELKKSQSLLDDSITLCPSLINNSDSTVKLEELIDLGDAKIDSLIYSENTVSGIITSKGKDICVVKSVIKDELKECDNLENPDENYDYSCSKWDSGDVNANPDSDFYFDEVTNTITGFNWDSNKENVIVPCEINDIEVKHIADSAFVAVELSSSSGLSYIGTPLKSLILPDSVTSIGAGAFAYNELTSVTIPNSVTSIGIGAFNGNNLPNDQAFIYKRNSDGTIDNTIVISYGGANKSIEIPNSVTSIGEEAFVGNNLTSVTIPNSVTSIGDRAFWQNDNLTTIILSGRSDLSGLSLGYKWNNGVTPTYQP